MSEETDSEEMLFRERVRDAIQAGGKSGVMARKTGIPVGTLNKYVSLRSTPSATNALKIARAIGLSVEELAQGVPVESGGGTAASGAEMRINSAIYKAVKKIVRQVYEAVGARLPDEVRDDECVRWYNELLDMARGNHDEAKLRSLLTALEYEIREEVSKAAAEPGSGKWSA